MINNELTLDNIKNINLNKLILIDVLTDLYIDVDYTSYQHYPMLILIDKRENINLPDNNQLTSVLSNVLEKPIIKMSNGYNSHMTKNIQTKICDKKLSSYTGIENLSQLFRGIDLYGINTGFDMPNEHYDFLGLLKYNVNTNKFKYSCTDNHQVIYSIIEHLLKAYHFNESLKDIQNKDVRNIYNKISKLNQTDKNELYKLLSVKEYH